MSTTELHAKILAFLIVEFNRKDNYVCTKLELVFANQGARDEELRSWIRTQTPDVFGEDMTKVEQLVTTILETAENHADSFTMGTHRYTLRTHQHMGGRATFSFKMLPSYSANAGGGGDDSLMLMGSGPSSPSKDALAVLGQHANALLRTNTTMHQATFGTLANITEDLRRRNSDLEIKLLQVTRERDEALSTKEEREFDIAMRMEKHQRSKLGFEKLLQFGTVVLAKLTGSVEMNTASGPHPLATLVYKFGDSLRPEQIQALVKALDMGQQAMFFEVMEMVRNIMEQQQAANAQASGQAHQSGPTNGTHGTPPA